VRHQACTAAATRSHARIVRVIAVLLLLPICLQTDAIGQSSVRSGRPNVLMIVVDDLNLTLGCYGNRVVKTPNIDRLASRAVRFERAYCQFPVCTPSRGSLLTGRRPTDSRIADITLRGLRALPGVVFLPHHFKSNGYFTARVGKIGHETFERLIRYDLAEDLTVTKDRGGTEAGSLELQIGPTAREDAEELDGATARRVVQILEAHKGGPFFIAAGFRRPHLPLVAPKRYFDLYRAQDIPALDEPPGHVSRIPSSVLTPIGRFASDAERRQFAAAYYGCVSFVDAQIGIVLDALLRLRLEESTIVVLMSDHGYHLGEHGGFGKGTLFAEATRVPLLISAPGAKKGASSPRVVELLDVYPTLSALCGLPAPAGLEGTSLAPLLADPTRAWDRPAFTTVRGQGTVGRSVQTEQYRYTEWGDVGAVVMAELYDLKADPREYRNLAADPKHATTVAAMRKLLERL
jgi:iduronate 2-sulfatase